jgi:hypothetical protein
MHRIARLLLISAAAIATPAIAQQTVPPAAPTIGASGGVGGGIAIPVGRLSDTHTAGYTLAGLVDFSAAEQPFSFRAELIYQRFDRKSSAAVNDMNVLSLGASLLARRTKQAASTYALGGIAVYRPTDQGTKPGLTAGFGIEVPLTYFIGFADVRLHYVLTERNPLLTIPITLGARF